MAESRLCRGCAADSVELGAAATATIAFFVVRAMWQKRPPDETSERIQSLIDEANRLIRTLEEKK